MTRPRLVRIGRLTLHGVNPRDPQRFRAAVEQAIAARLGGRPAAVGGSADAPLVARVADAVTHKVVK